MKGQCRTCKNWRRNTDKYDHIHYGKCSCPKLFYSADVYKGDYPSDGLEYCDCEAYGATMSTGALFGCIHHSPLPEGVTK